MPYPALHVRGRVRVFRKKKRARGTFSDGEEACPPKWGKEKSRSQGVGFLIHACCLNRSGHFAGTQTPGTNIYMARRTVDHSLHALDIGLPGAVGTPMRVRDLDAEAHALVAKFALCHPLHLLAVITYGSLAPQAVDIITDVRRNCKYYLTKKRIFFAWGKCCEKARRKI